MEQDFILISKKHTELFSVKSDKINNDLFAGNLKQHILEIVKKHNIGHKFKIVNLHNGIEKKYNVDRNSNNNIQNGGENEQNADKEKLFFSSWENLSSYVNKNIIKDCKDTSTNLQCGINTDHVKGLYEIFIDSGTKFNISKDELNKMFYNLLKSQNGGADDNQNLSNNQQSIDQTTIQPTEQPIQPTEQSTQPTEQPIQPTEQSTQPTEQPIQPTER
jgi:hypothetical protein